MKIGIVTVFYTENCGSVLQASALADTLKNYGCDVFFIDTRNRLSGHSLSRLFKNCIKCILRRELPFHEIKKYLFYSKYIREHFSIIKPSSPLDIVIIGSDTVWDITSDYFLLTKNIFWGINILCEQISTYAASIANSPYDELDSFGYPIEILKRIKHLSVRDRYTKEYVDIHSDKESELVCDPTLLQTRDYYLDKVHSKPKGDYVLLYLFNEPYPEIAERIRKFATEQNCRLISIICLGKKVMCADEYVDSTIDNFLDYFSGAKFVITNTFHGTLFSVIFNKRFVVLDYKKQKIKEFLRDLDLEKRITDKDIDAVLKSEINYTAVNDNIDRQREHSIKFIERILGNN